ncbi:hypothetical protein [Winogradskyella sp. A2]|uniref:hypothetical protein n=1 Tax=Winogradskyella sp. A2 TaxID=3366944 RepID=UPI00398C4EFB
MEFFRFINLKTQEKTIQEELTIENLDSISNEIFIIGDQNKSEADIGGIWGEFTLSRSQIRGGVRFALIECPNALTWTITTGLNPNPEVVVIHLTINRQQQEESFIEEIEEFLDDQSECLQQFFNSLYQLKGDLN